MSCHSGVSYLLARRAADSPLASEQRKLIAGVRSRVVSAQPIVTLPDPGAEAVLNLLALAIERRDPKAPLDDADRAALAALWKLQIRDGADRGSWTWVNAELDPMDAANSNYLGTAFAALALQSYASETTRLGEIRGYLERASVGQPLHHRLAWVAFAGSRGDRESAVLDELWRNQATDGGWSTAALGPWTRPADAPPDRGSNAYATAWAAYTAHAAGVACTDRRLSRALDWLAARQQPAGGWVAPSMNKRYPAGSIQSGFTSDAASGYAVAALAGCQR